MRVLVAALVIVMTLPMGHAVYAQEAKPMQPEISLRVPGQRELALPPEVLMALHEARDLRKRDPLAAEARIELAIKTRRDPVLLYELGVYRYERKALDEAWPLFEEVAAFDERFPGIHKNLGMLAYRRGNLVRARDELLKSMAYDGLDPDASALLGLIYLQEGKAAAAETALRWSLFFQAENEELLLALGQSLYRQRRYTEAERLALELIQLNPGKPEAWQLAAAACIANQEHAAAIDHLEAQLRLCEKVTPELHWTLGQLYLQENMPAQAVRVFADLLKTNASLQQTTLERLQQLLQAFYQKGETAEALAFAELILQKQPDQPQALLVKAHDARDRKDFSKAQNYYERTLQADPLNGDALLALGQILLESDIEGAREQGIAHLRSARALPRFEAAALRAEGNYYLQIRNFQEAQQVLRLLQQRYPDPSWDALLQEIRQRIRMVEK